jgi:hypothetical protein
LERTLPPLPESEDSASGTRIHAAFAGEKVELNEDEEDILRRCSELYAKAVTQIYGEANGIAAENECRMWMFSGRFSGKADILLRYARVGAIFDLKTGRNEVATAEGNAQLRSLAVLFQDHDRFDRIVVGIIQPWAKEPISLCEYSREDLAKAREWLVGVLDAAENPDAPRIPGEKQCRFCRAKQHGVCPEAKEQALNPTMSVSVVTESTDPKEIAYRLPSGNLAWFLGEASFAIDVIEACRDEAKRRLSAGDEVPGWRLKPGAKPETIVDLETVHGRFLSEGGATHTFLGCLSATKGKLLAALKSVSGKKGKSLEAAFDALIEGCVETKQNAPSLERVKEEK